MESGNDEVKRQFPKAGATDGAGLPEKEVSIEPPFHTKGRDSELLKPAVVGFAFDRIFGA